MSRTAEASKAALADMVSSRIKQLETEAADGGSAAALPPFEDFPTPALFAGELKETREPAKVLSTARQRYAALHQQCALMQRKLREANSVVLRLSKEKDRLNADVQKERSARSKLSELSRELQRQLKTEKEDATRLMATEKERHETLLQQFSTSLEDIHGKFEAHTKERTTLVEENEDLRKKLKAILDQLDVREEHFKKQLKAKELETKLEEAKHAQTASRLEQAQHELVAAKKDAEVCRASEAATREKLDVYVDKFESFQGTLTKSNETFKLYQTELRKMTKTIDTLEREKESLRRGKAKSDVALIESTEALQRAHSELAKLKEQRDKVLQQLVQLRKAQKGKEGTGSDCAGEETAGATASGASPQEAAT